MNPLPRLLSPLLLLFASSPLLFGVPGDTDNDGLRDDVETGTGHFVSSSDTGTSPVLADTDNDSVPDGLEVNLGTSPVSASSKTSRPNIILINCDDLGYGDVGCFWQNQKTGTQKFATPGIDAMAAEGVKLTHHYAGAPICASSRCSLMQGRHQGNADLRDQAFDAPLPANHTIASVLKGAGYRTIHVGKAGLAGYGVTNLPAHPLLRGFDRFFGYYSHYHAQEHYPQNGNSGQSASIYDDYRRVTDAYVDLYTTDAWTAFTKKTIVEETQAHPAQPFFIYLAYDAPHFANQMPSTKGYPTGKGLNGGVRWTGAPSYVNTTANDPANINNLANQHPSVNPDWPQYAREHVTMIRRIDDGVADILQTLRDLRIDSNTLVIFTSDNGPDYFRINPAFFQGFANFEGTKTDIWEGGLRVPTIAWWPGHILGSNNLSEILSVTRPSANYDWLATFAEAAAITPPAFTDGTSILPSLTGKGIQRDKDFLYFEYNSPNGATFAHLGFTYHAGDLQNQSQAIRIGDFMGVRNNIQSDTDNFKIYNVVTDTRQGINLAASKPEMQDKMKELAVSARRPASGFPRPYDQTPMPSIASAAMTNGVKYLCYEGNWTWLPEFRNLTPTASGTTTNFTPNVRSRPNDVGITFTGYISVPTTGAYTFASTSNSGSSLWIHEANVIDNDAIYLPTKKSGAVYLAAGLHPFRLYYRHQSGAATLGLQYSGPGFAMKAVPSSALFTEGPDPVILPQADMVYVKKNNSILIDALANDTANYPLTLQSTKGARFANIQITSGKLLYNSATNFIGSETFSYTETGGAVSADGTVTANVLFDNETWIPLDENSGITVPAFDPIHPAVGTLTGTHNSADSWGMGKFQQCLSFDGIDDQVDFPDMQLPTGNSPRTFACWVKSMNGSGNESQALFSYGTAVEGQRFTIKLNGTSHSNTDKAIGVEVQNGYVIGTKKINDGNWHHIAVVVDDHDGDGSVNVNETLIYVDGVRDTIGNSLPMAINTIPGFTPAIAGSNHASNYNFDGSIDDIRIFPNALSSADVALLRNTSVNNIYVPDDSDIDGDGMKLIQELLAGTDPTDSRSLFKITSMSIGSSEITLHWFAVAGKNYFVEESPDMKTWKPVANLPSFNSISDNPEAGVTFPRSNESTGFLRLGVN